MGVNRQQVGEGMRRINAAAKELDNVSLQVGWFESAKYDDDTPVAQVAAQNEFGNPQRGIPPRPFFRPTIAAESDNWKKLAGKGARAVFAGNETATSVMEKLGLLSSGQIRETISKVSSPPLSPVTIALRAYRNRNPGSRGKIGRKFIRQVAGAIESGQTGTGELGDQTFGNQNPLDDSNFMIASLTHAVYSKQLDLFGGV